MFLHPQAPVLLDQPLPGHVPAHSATLADIVLSQFSAFPSLVAALLGVSYLPGPRRLRQAAALLLLEVPNPALPRTTTSQVRLARVAAKRHQLPPVTP